MTPVPVRTVVLVDDEDHLREATRVGLEPVARGVDAPAAASTAHLPAGARGGYG